MSQLGLKGGGEEGCGWKEHSGQREQPGMAPRRREHGSCVEWKKASAGDELWMRLKGQARVPS